MSLRRRQSGIAGTLAVVVLIFLMLGILATYLLTRVQSNTGEREQTIARFEKAKAALDAFAATASRLPCPADPSLDTGEEAPVGGAATCSFPEGTLPWKAVGMKRDDSFDAWGRKISYRAYSGPAGFTRAGGASMVDCDTEDASPNPTVDGLCAKHPNVYFRSTLPSSFLAGKGLSMNDSGTARTDVAYVLISHGASGFGAYTSSGARLTLPVSVDERNNTRAAGAFSIRAFSDSDTSASSGTHFDDLLAYRRIEEMVRNAGLAARNWPEALPAATFNQSLIEGSVGHGVTPGQGIGTTSLHVPGVSVSVIDTDGSPPEISFDIVGGVGGIGAMNGLSSHLESGANEFLAFEFPKDSGRFAATLNHFGTYGSMYVEIVIFQYFKDGAVVKTGFGIGCNPDGGLASFSQDPGVPFDGVVIAPFTSINVFDGTPGITTFLVSEVKACDASESCATTLSVATPSNTCPSGFV